MKRSVQPEILDTLPPGDPRAVRSRRDLHRVNGLMRNRVIMAAALKNNWNGGGRLAEIGAGDGKFLLSVAKKFSPTLRNVEAALLDLQPNVSHETLAAFAAHGWRAEAIVGDVFEWLKNSAASEVVIANLFLHHFEDQRLAELLLLISQRAELFIAVDPRRAAWPLFCSRCLWAIGCNDVTRHDAAISVRAGFIGGEISALWPEKRNWRFTENRAGTFSHLFIAKKNN